jgi:hypothetical protein
MQEQHQAFYRLLPRKVNRERPNLSRIRQEEKALIYEGARWQQLVESPQQLQGSDDGS